MRRLCGGNASDNCKSLDTINTYYVSILKFLLSISVDESVHLARLSVQPSLNDRDTGSVAIINVRNDGHAGGRRIGCMEERG